MARVAFFHNALCKTDGVSLEVDKWRECLEELGHEGFYCAGNDDEEGIFCIPELSFFHPVTRKILENATVELKDYTESELEQAILEQAGIIREKLNAFLAEVRPDVLIPNNLLSVGYHVPAVLALAEVIRESKLPTISHNHDFYFEESGEVEPTCPAVKKILDQYAPLPFEHVQNLTINRIALAALKQHKSLDARVVPNVFDFDQPLWSRDEYNADFRSHFGIGSGDVLFLQATRVMDRKGIELAIDVVGAVQRRRAELEGKKLYDGRTFGENDRFVLVCAGKVEEFGSTSDYRQRLEARAEEQGVDIRFIGSRVRHSREQDAEGKIFSLWDSYVHADFVTYPSWWEGWGNQFIEAIFAKLPVVLFEYPVFCSDLAQDGFDVVSLGNKLSGKDARGLVTVEDEVVERAAGEIVTQLVDPERRERAVERNFSIAREKYSLPVLRGIISELLAKAGIQ